MPPVISDAARAARREQILDAARLSLQRHGLEAISMETIIEASGLSTGAIYTHFSGKDEIIRAVITEGTAALGARLRDAVAGAEPLPIPALLARALESIVAFGAQTPGTDRLNVALHGWSHAQSDPELRAAARKWYRQLRELFTAAVRRSVAAGLAPQSTDAAAMGELLTSLCLGFVTQRALVGQASAEAHVRAVQDLMSEKVTADAVGRSPGRARRPKAAAT